ncbi:MAG: hypothetical protein IH861_04150 [Chloroflexi bacterium]|nr:hypothetical protein [Chloroflexota bacterium]
MRKMRTIRKIPGIKPIVLGLSVALTVALAALFTSASVSAASPRDFFGIIVSVGEDSIEVEVDGEIRVIPVSDDTVIRLALKRDASLEDLFAGDAVAVSLDKDGAAGKVFVIPGKTKFRQISGIVTVATSTAITIKPQREEADPITFNIGPETRITFSGGATELVEGEFVIVLTKRDQTTGELSLNAIEIHVTPGQPHKRPERPAPDALENRAKVRGIFEGVDDDGNWIIGGARVLVDADTEIGSGIVAGQFVEVEGVLTAEGFLLAREIEAEERETPSVKRTRIQGVFEGVDDDGNWIIGGTVVVVNEHTDTDGLPYIGQTVRVIAIVEADGTIVAREIENKGPSRRHKRADNGIESRIKGIFEGVDDEGNWIVNGVKIAVDEDTEIDGTPSVGKLVQIKAILVGGRILAREIEVKNGGGEQKQKREVKFEGVVQRLTDNGFLIRGHRIAISDLTEIDGELTQGAMVKVEAIILEDGSIVAKEIEVKDEKPERRSRVKIEGIIEEVLTDHTFTVSGITIEVVRRTEVKGKIIEGAEVRVEGVLQHDGSVLAVRIKTEVKRVHDAVETEIEGVIDEVVRERGRVIAIVVDGVRIRIQALTEVDVRLHKGLRVTVEAIETDHGLLAVEINADNSGSGSVNSSRGQGYEGTVAHLADDRFQFANGTLFLITDDTDIEGDFAEGARVEVRAVVRNGELVAIEVEVIEIDIRDLDKGRYEGIVEDLGDDRFRLEDGTLFLITDDTDIDGDLAEGVEVKVKAVELRGELIAVEIKVVEIDIRDLDSERYEGIVEDVGDDRFRLEDGTLFLITDDTDIDGHLAEGVEVKVDAVELNGDLIAVRIEVRESVVDAGVKVEFDAVISEIYGDRLILDDGRVVLLTDDTDIDGELDEGVVVEILARRFANGRIVAIEIEVVEDGDVAYGA